MEQKHLKEYFASKEIKWMCNAQITQLLAFSSQSALNTENIMSHLLLFLLAATQAASLPGKYNASTTTRRRVARVLAEFPVIDGHNDFPMGLRQLLRNDVSKLDFDTDLTQVEPWASYWANHIDLPRMRKGQMGGQFWSAFIGCSAQFHDAVQLFLEQVQQ